MALRKEEGDYVDMSGLVFIGYFNIINLNKTYYNYRMMFSDAYGMYGFLKILIFNGGKNIFSFDIFRMAGRKCHDLKEDLVGTKFFIIFVKYVVYDWGLGAQALHMTDFKLHLF